MSDGEAQALPTGLQRPESRLDQEGHEVCVNIHAYMLLVPHESQHADGHARPLTKLSAPLLLINR